MSTDADLRRCILGGIAMLAGATTALVAVALYVPALDRLTGTPGFRTAAAAAGVVALLLMLSRIWLWRSHAYQRVVFGATAFAMALLLVAAAHTVSHKGVAVTCLAAATLLMLVAAGAGAERDLGATLGVPMFVGLLVLLAAGLLNGLVFRAPWLETALSLAGAVLFTAFAVYDANQFVRRRVCLHDCCEEGVFSLYTDFANVAMSLLDLNAK